MNNRSQIVGLFCLAILTLTAPPASAGPGSKAIRELAEHLFRHGGKKGAQESIETVAQRLAVASTKGGVHTLPAIRKVGPQGLKLVEEAGEYAPHAAKAMSLHGVRGATAVASRPAALKLVSKYGDDAIEGCVKHLGIAEDIIAQHGLPAAQALAKIGTQEGRRLAILSGSGTLKKIGRTDELLTIVAKHGDGALRWVWENKLRLFGTAAASTLLASFLVDPEPYITGAKDITQVVAEATVKPVAESAGKALEISAEKVMPSIGKETNWTVVFITFGLVAALFIAALLMHFGFRPLRTTRL